LGAAYDDGKGILEDDTLAHMWWNLAGANGHKVAAENRKLLEEEMTESQIQKAKELARNWKPAKK